MPYSSLELAVVIEIRIGRIMNKAAVSLQKWKRTHILRRIVNFINRGGLKVFASGGQNI